MESLQPLYDDINYTIELLRRLEDATPEVQKEILQLMKSRFPKEFGTMPDNFMAFLLRQVLKGNLSFFQWWLCKKIVKKGRWIRIISVVVRLGIVAILLLSSRNYLSKGENLRIRVMINQGFMYSNHLKVVTL